MNTAIKVVSEFFSKRGQSATSDLHVLLSNHPILVYIMYTCLYIFLESLSEALQRMSLQASSRHVHTNET